MKGADTKACKSGRVILNGVSILTALKRRRCARQMTHRTQQSNFHKSRIIGETCGTEALGGTVRTYNWAVSDITGSNEVNKSHDAAWRQRMAVLLCHLSKCKRNQKRRTHQSPWRRETRTCPSTFGAETSYDRLSLSRISDRGRHNSGIEVWKRMREFGDTNKIAEYSDGSEVAWIRSTRYENRGSTQKSQRHLAEQSVTDRARRGQGRTESVVADIRSQNDETITECWWLDLLSTG